MEVKHRRAAADAFGRAEALMREVEAVHPDLWEQLEDVCIARPVEWPDWCLLPMAATGQIAATRPGGLLGGPSPAVMSALYAWRFARSVWVIEPNLLSRLLTQVPDAVTVDDFTTLPEWCIYITGGDDPEWPGAGLWAHLEHDVNTGRPELRLMIDNTDEPLAIPVYLDRDSVTEALADYRATTLATFGDHRGMNVRGGEVDASAAALADSVDGYIGVLQYLCRPEADIMNARHYGRTPVRARKPKKPGSREVWLVGYADQA